MKKITILMFLCLSLYFFNTSVNAQVTDMGGVDMTINVDTIMGGKYVNIGKFTLNSGKTITVNQSIHFLEIEASVILIEGTINASGKGPTGGTGGAGGAFANGSGVSGKGGMGGSNGNGTGGGFGGIGAGNGGFITQICGNFLCSGNRDGLNGGGGGAGGGSGGSYGGASGAGGWGAFGTGFTGASGGTYGNGGVANAAHGNITDFNITFGSGGAGGGGGGGGWSYGTTGGTGGAGGGMVSLFASDSIELTITARIYCNGDAGNAGGTGGGESANNTYTCSVSGYSECGLCSESVYDGAGGAGGGAGGGSGGGIRIQTPGIMKLKSGALIQANGGNGGNKGYPNNTVGTCFDDAANGGGGSGGRVKIISTCNSANQYDLSVQTFGGTGHQNAGAGSFNIIPMLPDNASPIVSNDTIVCAGTTASYSITPVNNADSYIWTLPAGATISSGTGTNTIIVDWGVNSTSGLISVTPHNNCGDGLMEMIVVTVNPLPASIVNPANPSVCYGSSADFSATLDTSYTYQWQVDLSCSGNWADITGAVYHTYQTPNLYEAACYRLLTTNNCGTIPSNSIPVTLHNLPPTPVIDYQNLTTLISNAASGNQWYNSQGAIQGATNQTLNISQNESYYVIVTDVNGCVSAPSNIISFTVGINDNISENISMYPNPSNGLIHYTINNHSQEAVVIKISDAHGRLVFEETTLQNKGVINLLNVYSGVYSVNIIGKDINYLKRILIEK